MARFLPTTAAAFFEWYVREFFGLLALLACVGAIFSGVTADELAWLVGLVVAGLAGAVLVVLVHIRRWSFLWQWVVYVGDLVIEGGLIAAAQK